LFLLVVLLLVLVTLVGPVICGCVSVSVDVRCCRRFFVFCFVFVQLAVVLCPNVFWGDPTLILSGPASFCIVWVVVVVVVVVGVVVVAAAVSSCC
jgi:hypothetical protein